MERLAPPALQHAAAAPPTADRTSYLMSDDDLPDGSTRRGGAGAPATPPTAAATTARRGTWCRSVARALLTTWVTFVPCFVRSSGSSRTRRCTSRCTPCSPAPRAAVGARPPRPARPGRPLTGLRGHRRSRRSPAVRPEGVSAAHPRCLRPARPGRRPRRAPRRMTPSRAVICLRLSWSSNSAMRRSATSTTVTPAPRGRRALLRVDRTPGCAAEQGRTATVGAAGALSLGGA